MSLFARLFPPVSACAGCGRNWYTTKRRPCQKCGCTARIIARSLDDAIVVKDRLNQGRHQ